MLPRTHSRTIALLSAVVSFAGASSLNSSFAAGVGIIVSDPAGEQNWLSQTLKQVEQYALQGSQYAQQIEQYKNQIQNTVAPAAYLWDQAQEGMSQMRNLNDTLKNYSSYGGWNAYLDQFKSSAAYANSPCYSLTAMSGQCSAQTLFNDASKRSEARIQTNRGLAQTLHYQQDALQQDGHSLQQIQSQVSSADGQMKAIQGGNQMLGNIANQLLQLRATNVARDTAEATARQAQADEDARFVAGRRQVTQHVHPNLEIIGY